MAGQTPHDPAKALHYKEKGNQHYQSGDYHKAEILYTQAIKHDETNFQLYTNRAMANLKLAAAASAPTDLYTHHEQVIRDALTSIKLSPENLKAYYYLAQAQLATKKFDEAVVNSKRAHELCVEEINGKRGGQGAGNIGPITELVLTCKKEAWNAREERRLLAREGLLVELIELLGRELKMNVDRLRADRGRVDGEEEERLRKEYDTKVEELKSTFEVAGVVGEDSKRRKVPDWCLDEITFSVMVDPVITKSGQSYDRTSILEHLKRSKTDPITRSPLTPEDLIPNRVLKAACEDFLTNNGWAADW